MSRLPVTVESNAICLLSGAQRGVPTSGPFIEVNWMAFIPSESLTQISLLPERAEVNAMRLLSGEYCGPKSCRVEDIILVATGGLVEGEIGIRQMFVSPYS